MRMLGKGWILGYAEHHATVALLNLSLLGWFVYVAAPGLPRNTQSCSVAFGVAWHVFLGTVLSESGPPAALRSPNLLYLLLFGIFHCAAAAQLVKLHSRRIVQLRLLYIACLLNGFALAWISQIEVTVSDYTLRASCTYAIVVILSSSLLAYSASESRAIALSLVWALVSLMVLATMDVTFPSQAVGLSSSRNMRCPVKPARGSGHWSEIVRHIIMSLTLFNCRAAFCHAIWASQYRHLRPVMPLVVDAVPAKAKLSEWRWLCVLAVSTVITTQYAYLLPPLVAVNRHARELLSVPQNHDIGPLWRMITAVVVLCSYCALAVAVLMVSKSRCMLTCA